MDVFDLRDRLVADYASYTRSFIKIADPRISARLESDLNAGAFWPEPLLQFNPILVSYVAKGLLPYHGLGSGIKRALEEWPQIDFTDDREGCLFTATVSRTIAASSVKSSVKTEEQILGYLSEKTELTIPDLAEALGLSTRAVEKQIAKLRKGGRLRRVGSRKAGRWEVLGVDE
ncbi:MAG TPA: HTH domain-containing protein [Desulfatiglandales bacterium]